MIQKGHLTFRTALSPIVAVKGGTEASYLKSVAETDDSKEESQKHPGRIRHQVKELELVFTHLCRSFQRLEEDGVVAAICEDLATGSNDLEALAAEVPGFNLGRSLDSLYDAAGIVSGNADRWGWKVARQRFLEG